MTTRDRFGIFVLFGIVITMIIGNVVWWTRDSAPSSKELQTIISTVRGQTLAGIVSNDVIVRLMRTDRGEGVGLSPAISQITNRWFCTPLNLKSECSTGVLRGWEMEFLRGPLNFFQNTMLEIGRFELGSAETLWAFYQAKKPEIVAEYREEDTELQAMNRSRLAEIEAGLLTYLTPKGRAAVVAYLLAGEDSSRDYQQSEHRANRHEVVWPTSNRISLARMNAVDALERLAGGRRQREYAVFAYRRDVEGGTGLVLAWLAIVQDLKEEASK